jgi:hypothetical protein
MSDETVADYVTVEVAGKAAGISPRTLRHWIASGKLPAIAGKRGKLVSMGEVARMAELVGKPVGNSAILDGNTATSAATIAGNAAAPLAESALVSDAARLQLATIRDEWLAPLVERIGELERENGRLEATSDAKDETIAELRRRAEQAEAERDSLASAQAAPDAPGSTAAPIPDNPSGASAAGFWARVRRVLHGGGE